MKLRPLGNKVIVEPVDPPTKSASGIELVEHRKPRQVGRVLALGPHATKTDAKVGDTVLFSWQSGQEVCLDDAGTSVFIMLDVDLLSVIGPGTAIEAKDLIL